MYIEKVLVVSDESGVRKSLEEMVRQHRRSVLSVETRVAAETALSKDVFDLVFLSSHLSDGEGKDVLKYLNDLPAVTLKPLVVIVSGFNSVPSAVEAIKAGAFDYILKPFSLQEIEGELKKAETYRQLKEVNQFFSVHKDADTELLGESDAMQHVRELIRKVAPTAATVLITGENGTGKEVVAREIFRKSRLIDKPFLAVNCAAISENLMESEFFGHEKGAFTNATARRPGRFELADGGVLFLDEIAEIPTHLQPKLLRVLQEKTFERVGGTRTMKVNVRVLAATNRNLQRLMREGKFREDLYYRLNVFPIHIPPLRERKTDIIPMAETFLERCMKKYDAKLKGFSDDAKQLLTEHRWPGNVRELQNTVERAVLLSNGAPYITPAVLNISAASGVMTLRDDDLKKPEIVSTVSLDYVEKQHILHILKITRGNCTRAAKLLNITTRTLYNKLKAYRKTVREFKHINMEE